MARTAAAGTVPEKYLRLAQGRSFWGKVSVVAHVSPAAAAGGALAVAILATLRAWGGKRVELEGDSAPSVLNLAEFLGISVRTVQAKLAALERAGLVAVQRPPGKLPRWIVPPFDGEESANPRSSCGGSGRDERTPAAGVPGNRCAPVSVQKLKNHRKRKTRWPPPVEIKSMPAAFAPSEDDPGVKARRRENARVREILPKEGGAPSAALAYRSPASGGAEAGTGDRTAGPASLARRQEGEPEGAAQTSHDELLAALERENFGDLAGEVEGAAS